ncbi:Trehalose phosphorylase [Penicillium cinerascens]|uniref:Trehalose phosphorylase n=1 Tax=Penicillium cinerascens TaxID=70096 RepID=A0A9W9JFU8_9EURO|nr:Trehalose phosphorylase [Penicillium cinerascens]KAJ5195527.1 Trehalose phosphorylase [Penicillium cinerascens]
MVNHPSEDYITQIARFDPSKGLFDVLSGYSMFHDRMQEAQLNIKVPKLVIYGHRSIDDPDATRTYEAVVNQIEENMPHLRDHICVVRAKPSNQVLNAVLSKAKIVLQLSACEGFEIKVESGFLIEPHDPYNVAQRLLEVHTDEATAVGHSCLYLVKKLVEKLVEKKAWKS